MKKFLAIILALTLLLSVSVTAFAEDSATQTVSVSIPGYEYTVTIPADCTIEYKNTGLQSIGKVSVTSTDWSVFPANKKAVAVSLASNSGDLTNENGNRISYSLSAKIPIDGALLENGSFSCQFDWEEEYFIQVSDWSGAEPGTTYTTTITYNISLMNTWWD